MLSNAAAPEDGRAPLKRRSVPFLSQITHLRYTYLKPSLWGILTEYENLNARLAIRIAAAIGVLVLAWRIYAIGVARATVATRSQCW